MDFCATEVYQGWSLNRSVCSEGAKSHSNTILSEDIQIILSGVLLQEDSCCDPTLTAVEWVKKPSQPFLTLVSNITRYTLPNYRSFFLESQPTLKNLATDLSVTVAQNCRPLQCTSNPFGMRRFLSLDAETLQPAQVPSEDPRFRFCFLYAAFRVFAF